MYPIPLSPFKTILFYKNSAPRFADLKPDRRCGYGTIAKAQVVDKYKEVHALLDEGMITLDCDEPIDNNTGKFLSALVDGILLKKILAYRSTG